MDRYTTATKSILEWCDSTAPLLNGDKHQAEKNLLTSKLNDAIQKISTAREEISYNNLNLNRVAGSIVDVIVSIAADFDKKTIEFQKENRELYENLENKVQHLNSGLDELKAQLKNEIVNIVDLRIQIENVKEYLSLDDIPELRDEIRNAVEKLNSDCISYRKTHE